MGGGLQRDKLLLFLAPVPEAEHKQAQGNGAARHPRDHADANTAVAIFNRGLIRVEQFR